MANFTADGYKPSDSITAGNNIFRRITEILKKDVICGVT
jgi:hypothetical protein